jgi:hypothetical protein
MSDTQRRKNLLAAHSVALHVQVLAPVPPSMVSVICHTFSPDAPEVDVNFHMDLDGVQQLAEVLGVEATTRPHTAKAGSDLYTMAKAAIAGIPVKIWTLTDAPETGGEDA